MNRKEIIEAMSKNIGLRIAETTDKVSTLQLAEAAFDALLGILPEPLDDGNCPIYGNNSKGIYSRVMAEQLYNQLLSLRKLPEA